MGNDSTGLIAQTKQESEAPAWRIPGVKAPDQRSNQALRVSMILGRMLPPRREDEHDS